MKQQIQTFSVSAHGFYGLNPQDSPLDLAAGYAAIATNCVIDQYGRIGSRKGWSRVNTTSGNLGANNVGVIHELVQSDGTLTILFSGNNKLFKLDGSNAVVELTYGGGGSAPTITASNWHCASLNGITYFFQTGYDPLIYDPAVSTTTYMRVSEKTGYVATAPQTNIVISAYGRLWTASSTADTVTVYFSDLLAGHIWSTGTAGSLDIAKLHEITRIMDVNGCAKQSAWLSDIFQRQDFSDGIFAAYPAGAFVYGQGEKSKEASVAYGFQEIYIDGYLLSVKKYSQFNTEVTTGLTPQVDYFRNFGLIYPMGETKDAKTAQVYKNITIMYQQPPQGGTVGNGIRVWQYGGGSPNPTDGTMTNQIAMITYRGTRVCAANQFIIVQGN